ncbi:MAG: hypothetical protein AAF668_12015 [Pseudomonadota bacterium]
MILRRVIEHVRTQNWTAIALDFVIVVVGVFMGIQLGNWNEARQLNTQEATYLHQLRDEIHSNATAMQLKSPYLDLVISGGETGLAFLEGDGTCLSSCEDLVISLFHASQVWGTPFSDEKYQEVTRLGLPTDQTARDVIQELYLFLIGGNSINATPPPYRERVRGHFSFDASSALWRDCHQALDSGFEALSFNCRDALSAIDLTATLERIHADTELATMLRYWLGQNELARQTNNKWEALSDAALAAIDQALGEES